MRLRILHLITRLPIGGAERMLVGVLRNLDSERFESIVCCIQNRAELVGEVESLGIPVVCLGLMQGHGYDRAVVPALKRLMTDSRIDLMHSHLYHANLYGRLAARKLGIPAIASVHNTYSRPRWYRHLVNRYLAHSTFRIMSGSQEVEQDLLRHDHIPPHKIARFPNCIDLTRVESGLDAADAKRRLGLLPQDIVIGNVGRLEEQKGQRYLLDAFAALRQLPELQAVPLKLLIVGDGRLKSELQQQAGSLGIADACLFPGAISSLADVYRAIDIFVMPSLWEGLSLAMLEAMAAGVPMIATEVGGAREVLGKDEWGFVVPPGNAEALTAMLSKLLAQPGLRQAMGTAGAARVWEHYSVVALTRQLETLYSQACAA